MKLVGAVVGALIPVGMAWLAGYEFDARGVPAFAVATVSLLGAILGYGIVRDCTND